MEDADVERRGDEMGAGDPGRRGAKNDDDGSCESNVRCVWAEDNNGDGRSNADFGGGCGDSGVGRSSSGDDDGRGGTSGGCDDAVDLNDSADEDEDDERSGGENDDSAAKFDGSDCGEDDGCAEKDDNGEGNEGNDDRV